MLISSTKIDRVDVYLNGAIIHRTFQAQLKEGENKIEIEKVSPFIDPDSLRIYVNPTCLVKNIEFTKVKKTVSTVMESEQIKLLEKIKELEEKKEVLEREVELAENYLRSINKGVSISFLAQLISVFTRDVDPKRVVDVVSILEEESLRRIKPLLRKKEEIKKINDEIEVLKSRLSTSKKVLELGKLAIDIVANKDGLYQFKIIYAVNQAYWRPYYDIIITEDKAKLRLYAQLVQNTKIPWSDCIVSINSKRITRVEKPEPKTWFVKPIKPRPRKMLMTKMAKPAAPIRAEEKKVFEEAEEIVEPAYMTMDIESSTLGTYVSDRRINIEPGKPQLIMVQSFDFDCKLKYVWDAFASKDVIELAIFQNSDIKLPSGEARVYRDNIMVGKTVLNSLAPGQEVELALTIADFVDVEKRLIERKEVRRGLMGDKASIKMVYELKIKNYGDRSINIDVYDRIPVIKDPDVKVVLEECIPEKEETEVGVLKWKLNIPSKEEKKIKFTYSIVYPKEYEIPI